MAKSREFIGIAEGIKSKELSLASSIEDIKSTLSSLRLERLRLEKRISSLEAQLSAAENAEEPDDGLIASLELELQNTLEELAINEHEIGRNDIELAEKQIEAEKIEEEKQQTLFEIQQRARQTAQNISLASGMYGAYASVGNSVSQSFQASFDALAQAAAILDSSIGSVGGNRVRGEANQNQSRQKVQSIGGENSSLKSPNSIYLASKKSVALNSKQNNNIISNAYLTKKAGNAPAKKSSASSQEATQANISQHFLTANIGNKPSLDSKKESARKSTDYQHVGDKKSLLPGSRLHSSQLPTNAPKNSIISNIHKGRNNLAESIKIQQWEKGNFSIQNERALQRQAAKDSYEIYRKNVEKYIFKQNSGKIKTGYIDPITICGLSETNDEVSVEDVEIARAIPTVYKLAKNGKPLKEIAKRDDTVGKCASVYFLNDLITLTKVGEGYICNGDYFRPIKAALLADTKIPIKILGELQKREEISRPEPESASKKFREKIKKENKTISELIEDSDHEGLIRIITMEGIARRVDLNNIDTKIAREMTDALVKAKRQFPFINLAFFGSAQAQNSEIAKKLEDTLFRLYQQYNPEILDSDLREIANSEAEAYMKGLEIQKTDLAISLSGEKPKRISRPHKGMEMSGLVTEYLGKTNIAATYGIGINEFAAKDYDALVTSLKKNEESGASPKECNTIKYLIDHEIAHQLDDLLHISRDPEILIEFLSTKVKDSTEQINELCLYGYTNVREFVAEAWAESQNSSHPRRIALFVKEKIELAAKKYNSTFEGAEKGEYE